MPVGGRKPDTSRLHLNALVESALTAPEYTVVGAKLHIYRGSQTERRRSYNVAIARALDRDPLA